MVVKDFVFNTSSLSRPLLQSHILDFNFTIYTLLSFKFDPVPFFHLLVYNVPRNHKILYELLVFILFHLLPLFLPDNS